MSDIFIKNNNEKIIMMCMYWSILIWQYGYCTIPAHLCGIPQYPTNLKLAGLRGYVVLSPRTTA